MRGDQEIPVQNKAIHHSFKFGNRMHPQTEPLAQVSRAVFQRCWHMGTGSWRSLLCAVRRCVLYSVAKASTSHMALQLGSLSGVSRCELCGLVWHLRTAEERMLQVMDVHCIRRSRRERRRTWEPFCIKLLRHRINCNTSKKLISMRKRHAQER